RDCASYARQHVREEVLALGDRERRQTRAAEGALVALALGGERSRAIDRVERRRVRRFRRVAPGDETVLREEDDPRLRTIGDRLRSEERRVGEEDRMRG